MPQAIIPDSKTTMFARRCLSCIVLPVSEKMGSAPVDASQTAYLSVLPAPAQAETLSLTRRQLSRNAAGDHLRHADVVRQNAGLADKIGVEIGNHQIMRLTGVDRFDALDLRPTGNRVQAVAHFKLFRHPPAGA